MAACSVTEWAAFLDKEVSVSNSSQKALVSLKTLNNVVEDQSETRVFLLAV